jgi:hypothetical protein
MGNLAKCFGTLFMSPNENCFEKVLSMNMGKTFSTSFNFIQDQIAM